MTKGKKTRGPIAFAPTSFQSPPHLSCLTSVIPPEVLRCSLGEWTDAAVSLSVSALSSPSLLCSPSQTESLVMFSLQTSPHPHGALASVGERRDDSLIASHQRHTHPFIKWRWGARQPASQPAGQAASGPGSARTVSLQGQRKKWTPL